jgi:hypothetical protein
MPSLNQYFARKLKMFENLPKAGSTETVSLVDLLDRLLHAGVVADGQIVLTVAGVDLVYLGIRALLSSVETASRMTLVPSGASSR